MRTVTARPETANRTPERGASGRHQRQLVDPENGSALARCAGVVREMATGCQPLLALAAMWGMG
jgi:hypothetical protein